MKAKWIWSLMLSCMVSFAAFGQDTEECLGEDPSAWNWPDDKATAMEKNALFTDLAKAENWSEAVKPLHWLLDACPNLNPSLYIRGAEVYEGLGDAAADQDVQYAYYDSVLMMYDQRIQVYCDADYDVLDRKIYQAFKMFYKDIRMYDKLYSLYTDGFSKLGNKVGYYNLFPYFTIGAYHYSRNNAIEVEDLLSIYEAVSNAISYKSEAQPANADKYAQVQDKVDAMLVSVLGEEEMITIIQDRFCPQLDENPDDLKLAKKIVAYSLGAKETSSACFLRAAVVVFANDSTQAMAKTIADKYLLAEDYENATKYYEIAVELTEDNAERSELNLNIAKIMSQRGRKSLARTYAMRAMQDDPSNMAAPELIGDLYFGSFGDCKGGENIVHDRAVYIAAYNWYKRAGDTAKMARAKEQFPSAEEIFVVDMKVGDQYTISCWFTETVTIDKR